MKKKENLRKHLTDKKKKKKKSQNAMLVKIRLSGACEGGKDQTF